MSSQGVRLLSHSDGLLYQFSGCLREETRASLDGWTEPWSRRISIPGARDVVQSLEHLLSVRQALRLIFGTPSKILWHLPIVLPLRKWRPEDQFKAILSYIVSSRLT